MVSVEHPFRLEWETCDSTPNQSTERLDQIPGSRCWVPKIPFVPLVPLVPFVPESLPTGIDRSRINWHKRVSAICPGLTCPCEDRGGERCKLTTDGRVRFGQSVGQLLHAVGTRLGGLRDLTDESRCLNKVMIGGFTHERVEGLGQQIGPNIVDLYEHIQAMCDLRCRSGIGPEGRFQQNQTATLNFAFEHRPLISSFTQQDVRVAITVNQFRDAGRSCSVVGIEGKVSGPTDSDLGNAHQVPHVDDDFGVPNQEQVHFWIGLQARHGEPSIDAWLRDNLPDLPLRVIGQPVEGNPLNRLIIGIPFDHIGRSGPSIDSETREQYDGEPECPVACRKFPMRAMPPFTGLPGAGKTPNHSPPFAVPFPAMQACEGRVKL